ncbi:MAG: sugar phosphate isomerase/epimerase family protein [Eubacteriales bacterium]|nr:sugar phosphate isomerase/epimerase family protein [Eubacteriales bacterium]
MLKMGFNEGCTWDGNQGCADQSLMADLKACAKYGIKGIDIRFDCLAKYLEEGGTLEELKAFMDANDIVPLSYNALCFFNMKQTEEEKKAVMDELDDIIAKCAALDCHMVVVVPSCDLAEKNIHATRQEIRDDAVAVLKEMVKKCEPTGLKLSLEFCGAPTMSINTFDDAYEIVKLVDSPLMGVTLDQYHFHAMASTWEALENADGKKIFVWHLNDMEDLPCGAAYNTDAKRLWPSDPRGCLDHKRYADTLRKIGYDFENGFITMEVFRPDYYKMTTDENIKTAAEETAKHIQRYCK